MMKPVLIAVSVALALGVTACGRDDQRAEAPENERTTIAPGGGLAGTPAPTPGPLGTEELPSGSAAGTTPGAGASGAASGSASTENEQTGAMSGGTTR